LRRWTPPVRVGRVVKRLCASAVVRPAIGPIPHQKLGNRTPKRGGAHVKGRIACIKVVSDVGEEEG